MKTLIRTAILARADHYTHIAQIPNLESSNFDLEIWLGDVCSNLFGVLYTILDNDVSMYDGCPLSAPLYAFRNLVKSF